MDCLILSHKYYHKSSRTNYYNLSGLDHRLIKGDWRSCAGIQGFSNALSIGSLFGGGKSQTQIAAEQGALRLWGNSGASGLTGLLSRFGGLGGLVGAAAALAASIGIGSSIAGDKKIFGIGGGITSTIGAALGGPVGAVIAGAFNKLFGRGPLKFRQEVAIGTASSEGFDGRVTDVYRAKGGLFVGNKHKELDSPNSEALLALFDQTIKGFSVSIKVLRRTWACKPTRSRTSTKKYV